VGLGYRGEFAVSRLVALVVNAESEDEFLDKLTSTLSIGEGFKSRATGL
jgi:hypothetical protein